jgi:hypothetical protein
LSQVVCGGESAHSASRRIAEKPNHGLLGFATVCKWDTMNSRPRIAHTRPSNWTLNASGPGRRPAPMLAPPFPRQDPIRVSPQAASILFGFALHGGERAGSVESNVTPSEAVADHFQVDEAVTEMNSRDLTAVPVDVGDLDANDVPEELKS